MTELGRSLTHAIAELRALGTSFALVGGLAVSVRAEPRLTLDADLAVAVTDDAEAEVVVRHFVQAGYQLVATIEQDAVGRLATARLTRALDEHAIVTDLLFASCGIEPEIVARADVIEVLPGLTVPVASTGDLIAMKLLARDDRRRPADADDLAALAAVATDDDWARALSGVGLIEARGFARARDLGAALAQLRVAGAY